MAGLTNGPSDRYRVTDETGEYEIIAFVVYGRPGKDVHARVNKVDRPDVTEIRTWDAHERISVKRPSAEEGKR